MENLQTLLSNERKKVKTYGFMLLNCHVITCVCVCVCVCACVRACVKYDHQEFTSHLSGQEKDVELQRLRQQLTKMEGERYMHSSAGGGGGGGGGRGR